MISQIIDLFQHKKENQRKRALINFFNKNHYGQNNNNDNNKNNRVQPKAPIDHSAPKTSLVIVDQIRNHHVPFDHSNHQNTDNSYSYKDTQKTVRKYEMPKERTAATELASRLLEADKKRRNYMPKYPGLERFQMIRKLGDGAFSNVYEAHDLVTGRKVAIKVAQKSIEKNNGRRHLHSDVIKKPKATERANIMKEVQIMRNVRHPNIVQLIHYMESDENYFLTMELCEGGEVFHQIVKLTYFSEELSRHVIVQIAQAVRHLHEECGVVHRDIKPENILFDPIPIIPSKTRKYRPSDNIETKVDEGEFIPGVGGGGIGRVKLADFGLSKVIWNDSTFTPCGTVGYTAPEIVCDRTYSKSVDMWAIGCVLYTMLCGFPPFYDESIRALTEKVAKGQYTFLSPWWDTMSVSVKDLISHLLCVDVRKRYTIDQFLNHPWVRKDPSLQQQDFTSAYSSTRYSPPQIVVAPYNNDYRQAQKNTKQQGLEEMMQEAARTNLLTPPEIELNDDLLMNDNNSVVYTSPDPNTLKGIFDISYAVQRMGEEQSPDDSIMEEAEPHHQPQDAHKQPANNTNNYHLQVPNTQRTQHLDIAQRLARKSRGLADPLNYCKNIPATKPSAAPSKQVPVYPHEDAFRLDLNKATLLNNRRGVNNMGIKV